MAAVAAVGGLAAAFAGTAGRDRRRVALHAEGRAWTRGELADAIAAATTTLREHWGVGYGDRVGYLGVNRSEELVLLFAVARLGAILVPLNTRLAIGELVGLVVHAGLRMLVVDAGHRAVGGAVLEGAAARSGDAAALRSIDDLGRDANDRDGRGDDRAAVDADTPVLLVYTSGTTGAPKGALHTHGGLLANVRASVAAHDLTEDDRVLTVLPLFHVGGLCIQTLPALIAGAGVVLQPRFEAGAWLAAIATMRPTLTLMVPATLRAALAHPDWSIADLSCLRVLMAGSSVIPRTLIDAVHAHGVPLGQIYGSTETGPVTIALKAADARRKPGRAGWPCVPDTVRVIDAAGNDVASDAVGEIVVRAPNVMRGYWREPPTAGFRDGWFATGDLGRRDADGCFEIVGRTRDLIISGGENVYPAEVEDALLSIEGVAEVAVIGVGDDRWGEVPAAFVVRRPGATGLDAAALRAACDGRLARYKQPKRIVFVTELPRNAMGKVQPQLLRERLEDERTTRDA